MSWKDLACLGIIIVGVVLFLHGSNYYNQFTGWAGIYLILAGFFAEIILRIWESLRGKRVVN